MAMVLLNTSLMQASNLPSKATKVSELSPHCRTELLGVDFISLSPFTLDELYLLAGDRGCVVFQDQDAFLNCDFEARKKITSHFRPLHVHGWMPHTANRPMEFVLVCDSNYDLRIRKLRARKISSNFMLINHQKPSRLALLSSRCWRVQQVYVKIQSYTAQYVHPKNCRRGLGIDWRTWGLSIQQPMP